MSRWRSVWLVARREILERGRSRGFVLSVLFTTLLVVGSFVVTDSLRRSVDQLFEDITGGIDVSVRAARDQIEQCIRGVQ